MRHRLQHVDGGCLRALCVRHTRCSAARATRCAFAACQRGIVLVLQFFIRAAEFCQLLVCCRARHCPLRQNWALRSECQSAQPVSTQLTRRALSCSSIPLGLMAGRPFRPFNRAISSRCSAMMRSSAVTLPGSFTTSSCSAPCDRPDIAGEAVPSSLNRVAPRRSKQEISPRPGFCPAYDAQTNPSAATPQPRLHTAGVTG